MPDATVTVQLSLPGFQGSAALLLSELERGRRPVEEVSVSAISAQFRDWLRQSEEVDLLAAGELLAAGARLASLKSAVLLAAPVENEPEEVQPELAEADPFPAQAGARLNDLQGSESFPVVVSPRLIERRVEPRSPRLLAAALLDVRRRQAEGRTRLSLPAFVRLEVAVSSLIRRLKAGGRVSLKRLLRGSTRQDAVVHFLAVLDLVRRRHAVAAQPTLFDDISLEWVEPAANADSRVG